MPGGDCLRAFGAEGLWFDSHPPSASSGQASDAAATRIRKRGLGVVGRPGWQGALKLLGAAGSRRGTPG